MDKRPAATGKFITATLIVLTLCAAAAGDVCAAAYLGIVCFGMLVFFRGVID